MRIILASQSPRRKELLKLVVSTFETIVSNTDEHLIEGLSIEDQVMQVSYQKAKNVFDITTGDRIVIGSDTMVVKNNKIYGKPKSKEHAKEIIKELLSGDRTHNIITGLSVISEVNGVVKNHNTYDIIKVFFKDISDDEIDNWINTGKSMDKAGAYSIQDDFCVHIEKIEGNYQSAIGLPTHKIYDIIREYLNY